MSGEEVEREIRRIKQRLAALDAERNELERTLLSLEQKWRSHGCFPCLEGEPKDNQVGIFSGGLSPAALEWPGNPGHVACLLLRVNDKIRL